jgi:hypothetical protein
MPAEEQPEDLSILRATLLLFGFAVTVVLSVVAMTYVETTHLSHVPFPAVGDYCSPGMGAHLSVSGAICMCTDNGLWSCVEQQRR